MGILQELRLSLSDRLDCVILQAGIIHQTWETDYGH